MSRKSLFLGTSIILALLVGGVGTVVFLIFHEPHTYRQASTPPGKERKQRADEFKNEFSHLLNEVLYEREWGAQFTEEQINSYFEEDFVRSGTLQTILPQAVCEPRITIQPDKIRLAFRYGSEEWHTVITVDMQLWLVPKEPNLVAVELEGLHAGLLPISAQSMLDQISESARQQKIDVTWYRHNGNPVALVRFQADRPHPTFQLKGLTLQAGKIDIRGRAIDPTPIRAMLAPLGVKPVAN